MPEIITAETLPVKRLESERDEVISAAKDLVIETTSDIEIADSYLVKLAKGIDTAKAALKPMRDSTTAAWKAGTELEKRLVGPMEEAKKLLANRRGEAWKRITDEAAVLASVAMDAGDFDNLPAAPEVAKQGVTSGEIWKAEVVDMKAFLEYCLQHPDRAGAFLIPNESALNQMAKILKDTFDIPGCRLVKSYSSTVRTKPGEWRFRKPTKGDDQ